MNPVYSVLESEYRWLILAGLSFGAGFVGAIAMLAFIWPHTLARIWFYAGFVLGLYFLIRAFLEWKASVDGRPSDRAAPERLQRGRRPGR